MNKAFRFAGQSSDAFGLIVSGPKVYDAPGRSVDRLAVPGRNGDLLLDNGRYDNITLAYTVGIPENVVGGSFALREWLCSKAGYERLEDDYHPDYFRLARYAGPMEFSLSDLHRAGEVTLYFDCKPQRFYKHGEAVQSFFVSGQTIVGWAPFPAAPLITVYGSGAGSVTVGGRRIDIRSMEGTLVVDCELMDAYRQEADGSITNCNGDIACDRFPVLEFGEYTVDFDGGVTGVGIVPRYWTL